MLIMGKRDGGYLVECRKGERRHRFLVQTLGYQVRCPVCGHRESAVDLATDFVFTGRAAHLGDRYSGKPLGVAELAVNDDYWVEVRRSLGGRPA